MSYDHTLNLPQTDFPMRANLPKREPQILEKWERMDLYARVQEAAKGRKKFILHDGPPYANGDTHLGHALNKILKDFIVKLKTMDGFDAPYVPGWDTHGLPIENAIIKSQKIDRTSMDVVAFRAACTEYARKFIEIQKVQFKRFGIRGDFSHPYVTMDPSYEAEQIRVFGAMAEQGYIYKGLKPVYWCPSCETALAEAEIEYEPKKSPSIYVAFPVQDGKGVLADGVEVVIWTTTPWTLPANAAVAVGADFEYAVVDVGGRRLLLARELVSDALADMGLDAAATVGPVLSGRELEGVVCRHPFYDRVSPVILGEHVTLEAGTGAVHTAPGHGMDDYTVGLKYDLPILAPVDDKGRFTEEAAPFAGQFYAKANGAVIAHLEERGMLLANKEFVHPYPHCWRCKNPVIYRATEQWFASIAAFRQTMLDEVERVDWLVPWGKIRLHNMVADRADWCISRQRAWGVPIPVFYCEDCGGTLLDKTTVEHVASLFAEHGSQVWFATPAVDLLPEGAACPDCNGRHVRKETDIMDVWFDSGSSHAAVLRQREELAWPADLYIEGSDQYRGWFNSSLSTAVAVYGHAPYRQVVSHGFFLDGEGRKMSKSLGNGIDPRNVIEQMGADILRLWVASVDYRADVRISQGILKQVSEVYRKIRNTFRFLLGNLYDFEPADAVSHEELGDLDRYLLDRLAALQERCMAAYRQYEFHLVYHAVQNFCSVELSSFYLDVTKDALYVEAADSRKRRAVQTVMRECLLTLVGLVAPILTFTADEVWEYGGEAGYESIQQTTWRPLPDHYRDDALAERFDRLLAIRQDVMQALEEARQQKLIGQSLAAQVDIYGYEDSRLAERGGEGWKELLIVSAVQVHGPDEAVPEEAYRTERVSVVVTPAAGQKCERCWHVRTDVGARALRADLCARCADILEERGDAV